MGKKADIKALGENLLYFEGVFYTAIDRANERIGALEKTNDPDEIARIKRFSEALQDQMYRLLDTSKEQIENAQHAALQAHKKIEGAIEPAIDNLRAELTQVCIGTDKNHTRAINERRALADRVTAAQEQLGRFVTIVAGLEARIIQLEKHVADFQNRILNNHEAVCELTEEYHALLRRLETMGINFSVINRQPAAETTLAYADRPKCPNCGKATMDCDTEGNAFVLSATRIEIPLVCPHCTHYGKHILEWGDIPF